MALVVTAGRVQHGFADGIGTQCITHDQRAVTAANDDGTGNHTRPAGSTTRYRRGTQLRSRRTGSYFPANAMHKMS